jgi:hypothetical protein
MISPVLTSSPELAEMVRDAARYRAIRSLDWLDENILLTLGIDVSKGETLDAAIDAALSKEQA